MLILDSTKITTGSGRLPWAPMRGKCAGIKQHTAYLPDHGRSHKVVESTGNESDFILSEQLLDHRYIIVGDRAYGAHKRFDRYLTERQHLLFG
ncbi:transposase [Paenibacillus puerhi]|uniref:transposase n=1 Tax=Paenibacillus puerhi TaxID=2692622 RepID=UPI001357710C|nr:transposase [Paenibacillus puerhi]